MRHRPCKWPPAPSLPSRSYTLMARSQTWPAVNGKGSYGMEELWELRRYIETGDTAAALALLDEMDEMSRDDKIQKIASFMRGLLVHMIKQAVEHRTTKSWKVSIRHALRQI